MSSASDAIRLTVATTVAPELLWRVLVEPDHMRSWWGYATLEPVVGGVFRETWRDGDREVVTAGTVLAAEPPRRIVMDWADDDWPGATRLSISITTQPDGSSLLELLHDRWEVHPANRRERLMADHTAGWQYHLQNLTAYEKAFARGET